MENNFPTNNAGWLVAEAKGSILAGLSQLTPVPVPFPLGQGLDLSFEFEEAESQGQEVITPCCRALQLTGRTCGAVP